MTEKKEYEKVDFLDNVSVEVIFLYSQCKTGQGTSKTGEAYTWYLYAVKEKGEDKNFFAYPELHKTLILAKVGKDVKATITHRQRTDNKKLKYWEVKTASGTFTSDDLDSVRTANEVGEVEKKRDSQKAFYDNTDNLIELYEQIHSRFVKGGIIPPDEIEKATVCVFTSATINRVAPLKQNNVKIDPPVDDVPPPSDKDLPF